LENIASDPTITVNQTYHIGRIIYQSSATRPKIWNGTTWKSLAYTDDVSNISISGTTNEIEVSTSGSNVTIGLPDDVTIGRHLTVTGNLTVNGDTTTLNTSTLSVEDNIILLNNGVSGTPTLNAGIEVQRGSLANASLLWNESTTKWYAGIKNSEVEIALVGHNHTSGNITDFTEAVQDVVGSSSFLYGSNSISTTYNDNGNTLTFDTILASSNPYLTKTNGLAVDKTNLESALITDGFTRKYSALNTLLNVNSGVATWTVTHGLGNQDVIVQLRDATTNAVVEADVAINTSTVVININSNAASITAGTYKVVVIG
jgi:hypothetical protein